MASGAPGRRAAAGGAASAPGHVPESTATTAVAGSSAARSLARGAGRFDKSALEPCSVQVTDTSDWLGVVYWTVRSPGDAAPPRPTSGPAPVAASNSAGALGVSGRTGNSSVVPSIASRGQ